MGLVLTATGSNFEANNVGLFRQLRTAWSIGAS